MSTNASACTEKVNWPGVSRTEAVGLLGGLSRVHRLRFELPKVADKVGLDIPFDHSAELIAGR